MLRRRRPALGVADARFDAKAVRTRLAGLGAEGEVAARLDERVVDALPSILALSDVSSALAVAYVERVARPIAVMSPHAGARLVVRGYLAHLLIERDAAAFGIDDIPVLDVPPLTRQGRPPQDLLTRVVKATRRQFDVICALSPEAWEGFVTATTGHVHAEAVRTARQDDAGDEPSYLDPLVVDGLLRTGWVLRQVDLAYHQEPERRP